MSLETLMRKIEETGLTLKELERMAIRYTLYLPFINKIEDLVQDNLDLFGGKLGVSKLELAFEFLEKQVAEHKAKHDSLQPDKVEHLIEADKRIGEQ